MLNIKSLVIPVIIGYGLYYTFTHYDITPFPPMINTVKETLIKDNPDYENYFMDVIHGGCNRTKGGLTDSVFTCRIDFHKKKGADAYEQDIYMVKKNGKWRIQGYGPRSNTPS